MEYNLNNPKRKSIFQQFLYNKELKFSEIERLTRIRSNELAYFIQKLVDEGTIEKHDDVYRLSRQAEKYIPFFIESDDEMHPLPCVLVACVKDNQILLWKRKKRPYDDHWSLPGGRLRFSETMAEATTRLLKEKTFMDGEMISVNALLSEKNVEEDNIKHSYLLILTRAEPLSDIKGSDTVQWFPINALPDKMIPSDRWFVENKRNSNIEFKEERLISHGDALTIEFS